MSKERYNQVVDEAYENYKKDQTGIIGSDWTYRLSTPSGHDLFRLYTKEEFVEKCKKDPKFWSEWSLSENWGLKIEERELSLEERFNIYKPGGKFSVFQENYPGTHKRNNPNDLLDDFDIPTKQITLTYNNEKIETYE